MAPEVKGMCDQVIQEMYMTAERKRIPEVHQEVIRRLNDINKFRPESDQVSVPSRRTLYREVERKPVYEVMWRATANAAPKSNFGYLVSGLKPPAPLLRISMDHTPSDIIVVDDRTMLPLGRPTITSALDEHTRCPMGFYTGFEPPSCLSVMRCSIPGSSTWISPKYWTCFRPYLPLS